MHKMLGRLLWKEMRQGLLLAIGMALLIPFRLSAQRRELLACLLLHEEQFYVMTVDTE